MRGIGPLFALLLANVAPLVHAATSAKRPMKAEGTQQVTWTAFQKLDKGLANLNALYATAEMYFNWVKEQPTAFTGTGLDAKEHSLLVAAVYNPQTKTVAASTIPRGEYDRKLKEASKAKKLVWAHSRDTFNGPSLGQARGRMDAEDGAYYTLEMNNGLDGKTQSERYGDGTKENSVWVAVYGIKSAKVEPGPNELKDLQALLKLPDCTSLAHRMGVHFEVVPSVPIPTPTPASTPVPAPAKNHPALAHRPGTPSKDSTGKRPASQSPPKSPNTHHDDKKKPKKHGKRRAGRRSAVAIEVGA
ncbi:uncharacterized protein PG998_010473 [Apiospora kogelbergensis]|uniref:uncharacterized protein n=1 Tax=Apiospora kogelbergensis TaxID=1337665 RepID=UPI0031304455